ncbi:hypothetical protein EOM86_12495, partial [Candidatus Nomurabacteria bacterium]|nr:hypothetical protein [Candidatus Nomurabacteria bacterium]
MKKRKDKNVLLATLGMSAAVISETAIKLEAEGTILERIVIVHTDDARVWERQTNTGIRIGLSDLIRYFAVLKEDNEYVKTVSLGRDDIVSL